jgi:hypothetical protein
MKLPVSSLYYFFGRYQLLEVDGAQYVRSQRPQRRHVWGERLIMKATASSRVAATVLPGQDVWRKTGKTDCLGALAAASSRFVDLGEDVAGHSCGIGAVIWGTIYAAEIFRSSLSCVAEMLNLTPDIIARLIGINIVWARMCSKSVIPENIFL